MLVNYIKRGAYNTFFYGLSSAISRIISFLFFPYLLSRVSLAEFGIWDFYQMFFSLGSTVLTSCASASLIRFYFLYKDDSLKLKQSIGNSYLMVVIGIVVLVIVLFFLNSVTIIPIQNNYLTITFLNICLFSFFALTTAFLRIQEKLITYVLLFAGQSIMATAIMIGGISYGFGINAFFYGNLISLLVFLPFFIIYFAQYWSFSVPLLRQQLRFSIPLLLYSLLYTGFFSLDRFFIKAYCGYETLGSYSLLWRFGILYQFFSIALIDAWPIVSYNADKETNREYILSHLILYYVMVLIFLGLAAVAGSHCLLEWFIPHNYYHLRIYFPLFFLVLVILDCARLFQTSFCISINTNYIPIITAIILLVQIGLFMVTSYLNTIDLWKVLYINGIAFTLFSGVNYYYGSKFFKNIFDINRMSSIGLLGFTYFVMMQCVLLLAKPWYWSLIILFSWPIVVLLRTKKSEKDWVWYKIFQLLGSKAVPQLMEYDTHCYSNDIYNKKIAIFGPYPPPLGGISVHIQRVMNKLSRQHNEVCIFDTQKSYVRNITHTLKIIIFLLRNRPEIMYYHTSYSGFGLYELLPLVIGSQLLRAELILIEHDRRYLALQSFKFKVVFSFLMRFFYQQIFMGSTTFEQYKKYNITIKNNAIIETPFLPPDSDENELINKYPPTLLSFLQSHSPLITANAFQTILLADKDDLYGIEWCVDLTQELKPKFPGLGFIIFLSRIGNEHFFSYLKQKIEKLGLQDSIYILIGNYAYWPLLQKIDLFVRPTLSDNFGISIAEALYFGKKAIASDSCKRPNGTILFKCGDKKDFFGKVYNSLTELSS